LVIIRRYRLRTIETNFRGSSSAPRKAGIGVKAVLEARLEHITSA